MIRNFFTIIRWPNLLMLAGIQSLVYFKLLYQDVTKLNPISFLLLVIITMLLAAGGYVINDLFDREIDRINRPDRVLASGQWKPQKVQWIYIMLVGIGLLFSTFTALYLDLLAYIFIYPLAVFGLWFYSYAFKCKPVIGNLWVSIFCGSVILIIALPDHIFMNDAAIKTELYFYVVFAFMATWYREIVKDIEDIEGDAGAKCRTFPVIFGVRPAKIFATLLGGLLCLLAIYWNNMQSNAFLSMGLLIIEGFTIASIAFVWWAKTPYYYHQASTIIKFVMTTGTVLLFFIP